LAGQRAMEVRDRRGTSPPMQVEGVASLKKAQSPLVSPHLE
jgi:hypothetical protein